MEKPYYHSQESVEEYIRLAKGVDGSAHIAKLIPYLTKGAKILELGTGPGKDWGLLSKNYTVVGSDYSKEFLEHLKSKSPEGRFLHLDAATLLVDESFDGIYSNKVLHHLTDEQLQSSIKRQHDLLASGGIICHTFWVGEGTRNLKGCLLITTRLKTYVAFSTHTSNCCCWNRTPSLKRTIHFC